MSIFDVPLSKLRHSPANVRTVNPDKAADKELIASIRAHGLWQNLVVRSSGDDLTYEVTAGGRRLAALQHLAEAGEIVAEGYPVPCRLEDVITPEEVGLVENLHRAELHPADKFVAFKRLADQGMTQKDIAAHFGISTNEVKKHLKLAGVHPDIVQAFRAGKLSLEAVMAYTLADDQERQLQVFKAGGMDAVSPWAIRRKLTIDAVEADSGIAKFVGLAAYKKAGGTVTQDLFQNGRYLHDVALLERLAEEKLEAEAQKLRDEGYGWVTATTDNFHPDMNLPQAGGRYEEPEEFLERMRAAEAELERLDHMDPDEEGFNIEAFDAAQEKVDELEDERERYWVAESELSDLGAVVRIGWDGALHINKGLQRPGHRQASAENGAGSTAASMAGSGKEDTGTPASLLADLMHYRMEAVRFSLMEDFPTADRLLRFTICKLVLSNHPWDAPLQLRTDWKANMVQQMLPCQATEELNRWRSEFDTGWLTKKTVDEQFAAFDQLLEEEQMAQVAYAVGHIMQPGDFADVARTLSGMLNERAPIEMRRAWTPDGETYFKRLKKDRLLEIGRELFGDEWHAEHKSWKKGPLVEHLEQQFRDADLGSPLRTWLPPEMYEGLCKELQP